MLIKAGEVFQQQAASVRETRSQMEGLLKNVEQQRLVAWANWRANPKEPGLSEAYKQICREQERLLAAVEEWKAANPDEEEETED